MNALTAHTSKLRAVARAAAQNTVDFVFPPVCLLCTQPRARARRWLCPACDSILQANASRKRCERCSINPEHKACTCAVVWDHPFERVFSLFEFDDTVRAIMHQIKYRGMNRLARDISADFSGYVPEQFWAGARWIVPVPLHPLRLLKRGYNQSLHLARGFGRSPRTQDATILDAIVRRRNTRTQTKLDRSERRGNICGAFVLRREAIPMVRGTVVVLVDDVVTTGVTTGECASVLLSAGAASVRVLSLARD